SRWEDCDLTVALKILKTDNDYKFTQELKILNNNSNHSNIIGLYGITK
ncbi:20020_t:CDS:2, partial [Dentiscutata erythropus]